MPPAPAHPRHALRLALSVAGGYTLFGAAWILLSDAAVHAVSTDPTWLAASQRGKGLAFVVLTALGLLALVHRGSRQMLQAVQRQDQQFRELHQSLAEVLWMVSPDGRRVLYVSPAFEAVYGLPVDAFMADPALWLSLVHPEDRAAALASGEVLQSQGSAECQYRIRRPDGAVRWLSDRKKLVRDARGQVLMIAGIAEDITERRLDQDLLRRNAQELAERNVELARFNRAAVDRELDMIALKREINALVGAQQLPPRYPVDFAGTAPVAVATAPRLTAAGTAAALA